MIGLILVCVLLASFFILVIILLCKSYTKDIIELEERVLQNEKRYKDYVTKEDYNNTMDFIISCDTQQDILIKNLDRRLEKIEINYRKEGEFEVACKKGRGGRKK